MNGTCEDDIDSICVLMICSRERGHRKDPTETRRETAQGHRQINKPHKKQEDRFVLRRSWTKPSAIKSRTSRSRLRSFSKTNLSVWQVLFLANSKMTSRTNCPFIIGRSCKACDRPCQVFERSCKVLARSCKMFERF